MVIRMKKKFVLLPAHEDEETKFFEYCYENRKSKARCGGLNCENCKVILMSDRFLGKKYHEETGIHQNKKPFIIMLNTAGCNLDCWFCYAYRLLKKSEYEMCNPGYIEAEDLSKYILCKLNLANRIPSNRFKLLSRVRITGGEPMWSDKDTMPEFDKDWFDHTVSYWLSFFNHFNSEISEMIRKGKLNLIDYKNVKLEIRTGNTFDIPTWITNRERISIRFDTNGLLFCSEKNAEQFIEGLYKMNEKLKEQGEKNYLNIFIDYSLKGATPNEFYWSQLKNLDKTLETDFDINDHPQFAGIKNIYRLKSKYLKKDPEFEDCIQLSVERGINHQGGIAFVNTEVGLDWNLFIKKVNGALGSNANLQLSDTDNPIQWTKQYGPQPYFSRYHSRGATIIIRSDNTKKEHNVSDSSEKLEELLEFYRTLRSQGKRYKIIFKPEKKKQTRLF